VILLPHSTKNWDYRHTLPHLAVFRAFGMFWIGKTKLNSTKGNQIIIINNHIEITVCLSCL
jgi:hypothetical protein